MKLYNLTKEDACRLSWVSLEAKSAHREAGCQYSGYDYDLHLDAVVNVAKQYLHLIEPDKHCVVLCAAALHDILEDCGKNYSDIVKICNKQVFVAQLDIDSAKMIADIVYNVTNELGKNRKERSTKTYPKIASCKLSTFVKLCDRIANGKFSYYINDEKGMFNLYKNEQPEFYKHLHNDEHGFDDMWKELNYLLLH